jgi:glutathione S-transferase
MKLYFAPGTCSLAAHIALIEAGVKHQIVRVDLKQKRTADGLDFNQINPKGYVPALELEGGALLTENSALLGYIGELNPAAKLIGPAGTMENFRVREWLGYISSEIHKNFSPLFRADLPEATAQFQRAALARRVGFINPALAGNSYLTGETFTVADAYLFTVLGWSGHLKFDLTPWPALPPYLERIAARKAVQTALQTEREAKAAARAAVSGA